MSRSSSERSTPRLGAKSGAKLLLPDDMAKFFRDFFSKKFQRKHNGLITSHVGKMFFSRPEGAARGPARHGTREAAGWPRPPGRGPHCWRVAATEPRHGERGGGTAGGCLGGRHGEGALRGGRDGAAAWRTGGGGTAGGGMMACGGSTVAGGYIIYLIRCEDVGG